MDLASIKKKIISAQSKLAWLVFAIAIIWPIFHMVLVNQLGISTWRFFGWGMYATPNPGSQSRLRVVLPNTGDFKSIDLIELHSALTRLSNNPFEESLCINLFTLNGQNDLQRLPISGLCRFSSIEVNLDYFLHLGSINHLSEIINRIFVGLAEPKGEAYAFLTHQRFNLFQRRAYIESDVYHIRNGGDEARYLGQIRNMEQR